MYVCLCRAVTRNVIVQAIDDGAHTVEMVAERTRACTSCQRCIETVEILLREHEHVNGDIES